MSLEEMDKTEDVVLLFEQLFYDTDVIGEKDYIRFVKRLNRDMTSEERLRVLTMIMMIITNKTNNK